MLTLEQAHAAARIAMHAAELTLTHFKAKNLKTSTKPDNTPVTCADLAAHDFLHDNLKQFFADIVFLSEESHESALEHSGQLERFWCADPLDGTQGFIDGSDDFVTCLALIENAQPVFGAIAHAPSQTVLFGSKNLGLYEATKNGYTQLNPKENSPSPIVLVSAREQVSELNWQAYFLHQPEFKTMGSAKKFIALLKGEAQAIMRQTPVHAWDIAAGHALCEAAGVPCELGSYAEYNLLKSIHTFFAGHACK